MTRRLLNLLTVLSLHLSPDACLAEPLESARG